MGVCGYINARALCDASQERVYHGCIANDHGDEGLAARPGACLLGAVRTGLHIPLSALSMIGDGRRRGRKGRARRPDVP